MSKRLPVWSDELDCWVLPLTKGQFCLVDEEDVSWVSQWDWAASQNGRGYFYAERGFNVDRKVRKVKLHREIAARVGIDISSYVDHWNRNTLDNRRANLRAATPRQNAQNRKTRSDSSSDIRGVYFRDTHGKWCARISDSNGLRKHLGYFDTAEEAHAAYCEASKRYHGEFGRTA